MYENLHRVVRFNVGGAYINLEERKLFVIII
jgi:hypothetical protein